jgi:hypothetical protein
MFESEYGWDEMEKLSFGGLVGFYGVLVMRFEGLWVEGEVRFWSWN